MNSTAAFTLLLIIWLVVPTRSLQAQGAAADSSGRLPSYTMGEVVVYGECDAAERAGTVYQWNARRLQPLDGHSARELLEYVPGIYFSRSVRNEYTFRLRGFEQRQVSVFLDGIPVSIPYDGVVDVSQFAAAGLDRVRVSHGVSSMLYGANSLGGAVELISRTPSRGPEGTARLEASNHGRVFGSVYGSGGTERLRVSGALSLDRADAFRLSGRFRPTRNEDGGERENSAYEKKHVGVKVHLLLRPTHTVGVHVSGTDNWYHVPPNAESDRARYWRFPMWRRSLASINSRHVLQPKASLRTAWFYDRYRNRLQSFDDAAYATQARGYAFDSVYDDHSIGVNLYPTLDVLPAGTTDLLLAYRKDVHRQHDGIAPFERYSTDLMTAGAEQRMAWREAWSMAVGATVHALRPLASGAGASRAVLLQANAQVALRAALRPGFTVHLALARKSRFPTLKELYSSRLARNVPNPELRSEAALHGETGLRYAASSLTAGVSLYWSRLRNLIASVAVGDGYMQMQNIHTAAIRGGELDVSYRGKAYAITVNYALLDAANTSAQRDARYLEYRPVHRLNAIAEVEPGMRLRAGLEATYTADQHFQNPDTRRWEQLNDMLLVHLRLEYEMGWSVRWYVRATNALDAAHFSEYGVPLPGRELMAGVRIDL